MCVCVCVWACVGMCVCLSLFLGIMLDSHLWPTHAQLRTIFQSLDKLTMNPFEGLFWDNWEACTASPHWWIPTRVQKVLDRIISKTSGSIWSLKVRECPSNGCENLGSHHSRQWGVQYEFVQNSSNIWLKKLIVKGAEGHCKSKSCYVRCRSRHTSKEQAFVSMHWKREAVQVQCTKMMSIWCLPKFNNFLNKTNSCWWEKNQIRTAKRFHQICTKTCLLSMQLNLPITKMFQLKISMKLQNYFLLFQLFKKKKRNQREEILPWQTEMAPMRRKFLVALKDNG